ncbi:murein biosynthesis integral membrane protein MurJ [Sulfurospirillum sp. 1612]|uniref:murein biosynthesis integral membrane protein MurJ n=1 Tax=Sulfurospirillum sp. 1612 TaxID=3094835 RepID=UPI002F92A22B
MFLKSFFTNSIGILISRIFGFIRDLLTASILGANLYSDIFFVAFKLPNLFRRIFAEGAFAQSFIPNFTKSRIKSLFTYRIFIKFFLFLILLSLLVSVFNNFFTKVIAIGFDEKDIELASTFVAINFYYLPLIFCVSFFASLLQYKNHFATTAFSTALLNIALITALLLSRDLTKVEIVYAMSYAVLIGGILQVIAHLIALYKKGLLKIFYVGYRYTRSDKKDKQTETFFKAFYHAIVGNSTAQVSAFLDTWLASFLASGSISYLYYGNRVFQLPLALFAIALSVGIFPKIARMLKSDHHDKALRLMGQSFWFLTFILCLSMVVGLILSDEIVKLLFQRGSFNATNAYHTSRVLSMYLIGLLPFGLSKIFSLWLYSQNQQNIAAKISIYSLVTNVILSLALIAPLGVEGLALASSVSGFVLLFFTIKAFGFNLFLDIISFKKTILLFAVIAVEIVVLLKFKEIIDVYL